MASRLVEATTALRCGTAPVNWKPELVPSICRVRVSHSLVPSSSKGISTLILGPKIAKGRITMASTQGAVDTASDKWTMPDSKGVGYETVVQVTPRDIWYWQADTHWKHWQGFWINYTPEKTKEVVKEYKSVRSLQIVDSERTKLYHRNQWYDAKGFGKDQNWEYGPWNMTLKDHSLHDGILHPNSSHHRILLMPSGNLGWIQMYLQPDSPRSVIFSDPCFMSTPSKEYLSLWAMTTRVISAWLFCWRRSRTQRREWTRRGLEPYGNTPGIH